MPKIHAMSPLRRPEPSSQDGWCGVAAGRGGRSLTAESRTNAGHVDLLAILLGLATLFALSPVLADLLGQWGAAPWSRYSVVFAVLTAVALARADRVEPLPRAVVWIAVAIGVAALLIAGGRMAWARLTIPLALIGWSRACGIADVRTASLGFFLVPTPAILHKWLAPALPEFLSGLASAISGTLGLSSEIVGRRLLTEGEAIAWTDFDGGVATMALFAGLAWMRSTQARRGVAIALLWTALGASFGLFVQFGVWIAAILVLNELGGHAAREVLDCGPTAIAVVAAIAAIATAPGKRQSGV